MAAGVGLGGGAVEEGFSVVAALLDPLCSIWSRSIELGTAAL